MKQKHARFTLVIRQGILTEFAGRRRRQEQWYPRHRLWGALRETKKSNIHIGDTQGNPIKFAARRRHRKQRHPRNWCWMSLRDQRSARFFTSET